MADIAPKHPHHTRSDGETTLEPADLAVRQTCCRREVMYDAICEGAPDTACLEALFDWLDERKR